MISRKLSLLLPVLLLAACAVAPRPADTSVRFETASVAELPQWQQQSVGDSLPALQQSCKAVAKKPEWSGVCRAAAAVPANDAEAVRRFFETHFQAWKLRDGERDSGLITGYYEPLLNGSRAKTARTPYPLYGVPADLLTLDVPAADRSKSVLVARRGPGNKLTLRAGATAAGPGEIEVRPADFNIDGRTGKLRGRLEGNRLRPYYSRAEIEQGKGVSGAPVLAWVENPVELFFLQVQGSGRIQLEDGSFLRVGYAEQNGYAYQSIGRWLVDRGELTLADASMQGIQEWIKANPSRQQELFNVNPSYVFFRPLPHAEGGPLGTLGVPLTDGYSIAVDPRYIPLGAPVYLATSWPLSNQPLVRLVHAQDTGGAIRGAIRADFFWGFGTEAGMYAGRMKQPGSLWILLPKGMKPSQPI
ncbi:murein transglycosylase A [Pseudogulbenkiania sp. MAI-1]|uniref:murein transglycosylase A n=1 Tax=Pseudogulbenkiania sp. MAI-1 TaxID=990370 RepID=UPI00045E8F70|nr:MltA domain-containing protein [Pseudogulbenkiania sp. MAI-1]